MEMQFGLTTSNDAGRSVSVSVNYPHVELSIQVGDATRRYAYLDNWEAAALVKAIQFAVDNLEEMARRQGV